MRNLTAALACLGIACAGAAANTVVTDYRVSDAELFDNSVDLIAAPVIVEGEWSGVFERRVHRADLIAEVRTQSLSSELIKRRSAYRLDVKVKDRLKGSSARELALRVSDEERGYRTVQVNEDRLLEESFIAFIKWESDPTSPDLIAHWHLSPDSDAVREKVKYWLRHRPPEPVMAAPEEQP